MARMGFEGVVRFLPNRVSDGGTWTVAEQVRDVTITGEKATGDATTRGYKNKRYVTALKDRGITLMMVYEPGDAGYDAFRDSFEANTHVESIIAVQAWDGDPDEAGHHGIQGDWIITKFGEPQQLEDVMGVEIELKPAHSDLAGDIQRVTS